MTSNDEYILVIAEKPSVAKNIADVIGATHPHRNDKGNGFLSGNGYIVSWCYGHLVELLTPDEYDEKYSNWSLDLLPIIPEKFRYKVIPSAKGQFDILKKLMTSPSCKEVIEATDAAREGELIFRLVAQEAGNRKPTKRLWLNSMENSAIQKSFSELRDISDFNNLYFSALARQRADWLFGMNFSRYYSGKYRSKLSYGRVQTVVVKFLTDRDNEIKNFVPKKYFKIVANLGEFSVTTKTETKTECDSIIGTCEGGTAVVQKIERNEKKKAPPLLYDLTTCQREANQYLGYSAAQTLETLQNLYEKKLASYPRTDSCYITASEENSTKELLAHLVSLNMYPGMKAVSENCSFSRVVDDSKVTDHSALLPTREVTLQKFNELSTQEKSILLMLCYRLLEVSMDSCIYAKSHATVTINEIPFEATGTEILHFGYRKYENALKKMFGVKIKEPSALPQLREGLTFDVKDISHSEEATKPLPHYTDDTLLSAMENCGNRIEEQELKDAIRDKGLGTPATRASIIEEIIKRGYATRNKKYILATDKAFTYIPLVNPKLVTPELTGKWEKQLNEISMGKFPYTDFMKDITDFVSDTISEFRTTESEVTENPFSSDTVIGKCPKCGKNVIERKLVYSCEDKKKDNPSCDFMVWKNFGNKNSPTAIRTEDMQSLLETGRTAKLLKFQGKTGKEFKAYLKFDENFRLTYDFPNKK